MEPSLVLSTLRDRAGSPQPRSTRGSAISSAPLRRKGFVERVRNAVTQHRKRHVVQTPPPSSSLRRKKLFGFVNGLRQQIVLNRQDNVLIPSQSRPGSRERVQLEAFAEANSRPEPQPRLQVQSQVQPRTTSQRSQGKTESQVQTPLMPQPVSPRVSQVKPPPPHPLSIAPPRPRSAAPRHRRPPPVAARHSPPPQQVKRESRVMSRRAKPRPNKNTSPPPSFSAPLYSTLSRSRNHRDRSPDIREVAGEGRQAPRRH